MTDMHMLQNSLHENAPGELSNPKSQTELHGGPLILDRSCFMRDWMDSPSFQFTFISKVKMLN